MRLPAVFALIILCGLVTATAVQAADLVVTADIDQTTLNTPFYKETGWFSAAIKVENVSASPKIITLWSNPGWSWTADNKAIQTSQEAQKNDPRRITLNPGYTYVGDIQVAADRKAARPITFRLGFLPNASTPNTDAANPAVIWSNDITLRQ